MKIGSLKLKNRTVLAPLAGITNLPFRLVAKDAGCGLVCSEMVSSNGLVYKSDKTRQLLQSVPEEKPMSLQIFGSDPVIMAEAAAIVAETKPDIIDINFGCSVKKVLKSGSGSALMKDPKKAEAIIKAVRNAIDTPFTIKIRTGWEPSGEQAFQIAKIAEDNGVDAIAMHPRTATQGFGGNANWSLIGELKRRVSIPVIGNGDIIEAEDAVKMLKMTGCDAVMIGRAAMGNPFIFNQVNDLIEGRKKTTVPFEKNFEIMRHFLKSSVEYFGEEIACNMMRSRLGWFVKGLPDCSSFRKEITSLSTEQEITDLIDAYYDNLSKRNISFEVGPYKQIN